MAYQFQQINDLFGTPQKQDIFAGQNQGQGGGQQAPSPGAAYEPGAPVTLSQTTGTPSGGGNVAAPKSSVITGQAPASKSQILQQSAGQTALPSAFGQASTSISDTQQNLQTQADKYLSQAQNYKPTIDVNAALQGGPSSTAFTGAQSTLSQKAATPVNPFQFSGSTIFPQIQALMGPGLQQTLAAEGGPQYTSAEQRFDVMNLQNNPVYQQNLATLQQQQANLANQVQNYQSTLQGQVQAQENQALQAAQQAARTDIQNRLAGIQGAVGQQAQAENAVRLALQQTPDQPYIQTQAAAEQAALAKSLPPDVAAQLGTVAPTVDASKYFKVGGQVDPTQFYNQSQANQFNMLNQLLNPAGGFQSVAAGQPVSAREGFDVTGYGNALTKAAQGISDQRAAQIAGELSGISGIINPLQAQVNAYNDALSRYQAGRDLQRSKDIENAVRSQANQLGRSYNDVDLNNLISSLQSDPGRYYQYAAPKTVNQMLTPEQLGQINAYRQQLINQGQILSPSPYKLEQPVTAPFAGQGSIQLNPYEYYNQAALNQAIQSGLAGIHPEAPGQSVQGTVGIIARDALSAAGRSLGNVVLGAGTPIVSPTFTPSQAPAPQQTKKGIEDVLETGQQQFTKIGQAMGF